jgi:hypothetical protein
MGKKESVRSEYEMNKFKIFGILIVLLILTSPLLLLVAPSWKTKVNPALNLVSTLMGPGAEDNLALGSFSFIGADNETLLLQIDLVINNTGGDMLFPSLNLSFSYGSFHLGTGWVNPEVLIPGGTVGSVPIYARMQKGDAFNMFLLSLIGGGLSLDITSGEAFLFLDTFGGSQAGVISIPLPSIPLPAIDLGGATFWPPTIHRVYRGNVSAGMPVEVQANVTDKGGGVKAVILSWTNGTQWVNTTMTGLPMKPIMGGAATALGSSIEGSFPAYPESPIPTTWEFGIVNGTIPAHPVGWNISYCLYLIDDFDYVTLVPSTLPTYTIGTADTADLLNHTFSYTVPSMPLGNSTAVWEPESGGTGEAGGVGDLLDSLAASGIDIFGAIMGASSLLSMLSGNFSPEVFIGMLKGIIEYLEVRGVNPFEFVDQMLGISGGIPGLDTSITCRDNSNMSLALDLLAEGQVSLLDLVSLLDVNMTQVVDSIASSVRPPLVEGATLGEALFNLLNATFADPGKNATFYAFLDDHDLYYEDYPFSTVYKYNQTEDSWADLTDQAFELTGNVATTYYFGAPKISGLLGDTPIANFTIIDVDILPGMYTNNGSKYQWEYYNGTWIPLPIAEDATHNLTTSGRIFFAPTMEMKSSKPNSAGDSLCWIRLRILDTLNETVHVNSISASADYIPFYYSYLATDMFGRLTQTMVVGETDSFVHLIHGMNASNGYASKIWGFMSSQGVSFDEFLALVDGHFVTFAGPIMASEIMTTTALMMALVVYGVLLMAVIAAVRGRGGTYSIKPSRVKKWYQEMAAPPGVGKAEALKHLKSEGGRDAR